MDQEITLRILTKDLDYIMKLLMDQPWLEVNMMIQRIMADANNPELQSSVVPGAIQG
jgi:hypothetical protein